MSEEHGNLIKSPKQLVVMVFASFFVPLIIIALLMVYVGSGKKPGANPDAAAEAANQLIKPVALLDFKDASGPKVFKTGEEVYKQACASCHASGAAGAPKFGDAGGWSARLGRGYDGLLSSLVKGKGAMPAVKIIVSSNCKAIALTTTLSVSGVSQDLITFRCGIG